MHVLGEPGDRLESVGRAAGGCEIRVIDDDGRELPVGETGEIVGRSGSMMMGYNNQLAATEALLWRDAAGAVYFRSGDVGRLDADGFLYLSDRKKDMIISGGLNVYAADLEPVVSQHPAVADVAVVAAPSERWGETPVAFVVLQPGHAPDAAAIIAWSNERLGKHQRLSGIEFCESLPRNALGKVLKRDLREEYRRRHLK
jgi:acyl-CoA synthetase (AMP-forming)/AMP-acid ligase II